MDVKLQVALVFLCALSLCDRSDGWHRHRAPYSGLRMPPRRKLITWDTFVNKVHSKMWSEIYLLPIQADFPVMLRFRSWPFVTGDMVHIPYHVRDGNGDCKTEADFDIGVDFTHTPGEKYAILKSGTQEDRYFSSDPDNHLFFVQCFDTSTIVNGVCKGEGLLSLVVPVFPPNQLNWWRIVWDLKKVMRLTFLDPRWRFVAGAEGCV